MNILALDPSILHLGWAIMHTHFTDPSPPGCISILASGTIQIPSEYKKESLVKRICANLEALHDLDANVTTVVIEQPENWGAYKSLASSRSNSLLKLTLLTGALVGWAHLEIGDVELITVTQWKGQLPKHVTTRRMEKKYHCKFKTSDEADAVGLGTWYLLQQRKEDK